MTKDSQPGAFYYATKKVAENAAKRREKFLQLITEGASINDACRTIGMHRKTYEHWRANFPEFRDQMDVIRQGINQTKDGTSGLGSYQGDFTSFRKRYFNFDTYYHQRQIVRAIETADPGRIVMVLCPPEHGKTTVIEDYINYKLAVDPNHRITYVHESRDFARRVLGRVTQRMTDLGQFREYIMKFGPFRMEGQEKEGRPWTSDYFQVYKAKNDERDHSLQVRGINTSVQGTRTDLLILDDIQALKTLNLTEKIAQTLRQDYFSRPGRKGKIIMVGTRVGVADVYEAFLLDPALADLIDLIQLPALDKDGEPLCPELWSADDLKLKRALVGEEAWWRNYQQAPTSSGAQTFSEEMVTNAKDDMYEACKVYGSDPVVLGLDPALGGGNALIACQYNKDQLRVIDLQVDYGLARTEDILGRISEFAARYRPLDVIIETVAFQRGLARDDRLLDLAKAHGFRVGEHETGRNKTDPILGVSSMAGSFLRNEVRIPWGTQLASARMEPLVAQLLAWRPDIPTRLLKQDTVMALWFVWKFWMERRALFRQDTDIWNFQALPWKPMKAGIGGF